MGFLSKVVGEITGANDLADAQKRGSALQYQAIQDMLGDVDVSEEELRGILESGTAGNLGFLEEAQGLYSPMASGFQPAFESLQSTATAEGMGSRLSDILNNPDFAPLRDERARTTENYLSDQGIRRSGAGADIAAQRDLDLAMNLLNKEQQQQQYMAGMGSTGLSNISNILQNQGATTERGGTQMANMLQNMLANKMNLQGQGTQAQVAGIVGPAQTHAQSMGSFLNLASGLGGAYLGRPPAAGGA